MNYQIRKLSKGKALYLPVLITKMEDLKTIFRYKTANNTFEIAEDPEDNPAIAKALEDGDLPDIETTAWIYIEKNFSRGILYPGIPEVSRGSMDADPAEPPVYDLPNEDEFEQEVSKSWADEFLLENGFEENICSLKISSSDREAILEKANDLWLDTMKKWPDWEDLIELYGKIDEPEDY